MMPSGCAQPRPRLARHVAACIVLGFLAGGCQEEPPGYERFIPKPETARAAVVSMLDGWRKGLASDVAVGKRPVVQVVDKHRRPGQRLTRYEVLGEVGADNARSFAVRLTFDDSEESQVVRFIVLGIDPLWVFRQEDYELISHWMHPMDAPKDEAGDAGTTP